MNCRNGVVSKSETQLFDTQKLNELCFLLQMACLSLFNVNKAIFVSHANPLRSLHNACHFCDNVTLVLIYL